MKLSYKWPIKNRNQQALFVDKNGNQLSTQINTLNVGITTIVFYFITILYVYGSGRYQMRITPWWRIYTLSDSFQHCEKKGTVFLMLVLLALITGLYTAQNLSDPSDPMRIATISMNYVIFMTWFLFLYIWPAEKVHMPLAFITLIAIIINTSLLTVLYNQYFIGDDIIIIQNLTYVIVSFTLFAMLAMIMSHSFRFKFGTQFVALCELLVMISFGVFFIYFIQLPPLPDLDSLSCVINGS